ncbi:hypothetical protein M3Y98_00232400 [Aphelenchoides besseyi]|nr:hypothetical protein M3Y98_00232400 [Aphelenchoides besseyi]KAI6200600.1 hypothetical protein M3Y96_00751200 [Aphelenchoides besseyi]
MFKICNTTERPPEWLLSVYLQFMNLNFVVSLPAHLMILIFAIFKTPNGMHSYKITLTNTTIWSTLVLIWMSFVLRPFILFPLPIAISYGSFMIPNYQHAMFHFNLLIIFVLNMLTAMILCFINLCLYLIQAKIVNHIKMHHALLLGSLAHIISSVFGYFLLNKIYTPNPNLRSEVFGLASENNSDGCLATSLISSYSGVLFGYLPNVNYPIFSFLTWFMFTVIVVVVLACFSLLIIVLFRGINKSTRSRTWRFKRNVFLMLSSRTMIPLTLGFIPVIILTYLIYMHHQSMMLIGNALFALSTLQAPVNCLSTALIFKPYRRILLHYITGCLPQDIRERYNQTSSISVIHGRSVFRSSARTSPYHATKTAQITMISANESHRPRQR